MAVRSVEDSVYASVTITLEELGLGPEDAAAASLARKIALNIDETEDGIYASRWLAPELLKVLDALGATPAARARASKARGGENAAGAAAPVNWLDQQRQSRAARLAKRP